MTDLLGRARNPFRGAARRIRPRPEAGHTGRRRRADRRAEHEHRIRVGRGLPPRGVRRARGARGAGVGVGRRAWHGRGGRSPPAAVPGPPSGWSTVFSDDFSGAAGSGADSQWIYDTGPGSNFGTGEIETMTNSTSNVHLDGNGDLDITALGSG